MRVLVVTAPLTGHLLPLVPLASALREQGHEVLLAAGGDLRTVAGFPVHDMAGRLHMTRLGLRLAVTHPRLVGPEARGTAGVRAVGPMFGAINARLVDDVVAFARAVEPDVVLHEPLAVAGAVAASACGVPSVLVGMMLWDGPQLVAAVSADRGLRAAAARHGVGALPEPVAVLDSAPRSVVGERTGRPLRPVDPADGADEPSWLFAAGSRPRLLVTHSTIAGPGSTAHLRRVVAAAAGLDAEVVLVRAPERIARGPLPGTVRAVGWVPLARAMRHADAVVHHGGAGTALAALAAGVPQLVVAGSGDRRHNARLVAARGAGLATDGREITTELLTTLMQATPLRTAAREVAAEIAAMPEPAAVARDLGAALA